MNPTNPSEIAAAYNDWAATYDAVENRTRDLAGEVLRRVFLGARAPSPAMSEQREIETPDFDNLKLAGRTISTVPLVCASSIMARLFGCFNGSPQADSFRGNPRRYRLAAEGELLDNSARAPSQSANRERGR